MAKMKSQKKLSFILYEGAMYCGWEGIFSFSTDTYVGISAWKKDMAGINNAVPQLS